jgi:hypothetical protein
MSNAEEKTVSKDGYEVTFYPGFASRCTVRNAGGEVELYSQEGSYNLPNGEKLPKKNFRLSLKGGKRKAREGRMGPRRSRSTTTRCYAHLFAEAHKRADSIV